MNFYSFHIGDYASATRHLTWVEDIAYRRLLDIYYVSESPLPKELRQIFRLSVATTDEQREAIETILAEFFQETDIGYTHERCEAEITKAKDKKNKASLSALQRWGNANHKDEEMPTQSERNANAMPTHQLTHANAMPTQSERNENECEGNAPNPNPNPSKQQLPREPNGFAEFWESYPKKVGKGAAEVSFKKLQCSSKLPILLSSLAEQKKSDQWQKDNGQFIPNPATWLNQRRWEDTPAPAQPEKPKEAAPVYSSMPWLSPAAI